MSLVDDFFSRIIPAKLDEPTHATLHLDDNPTSIAIMVVLRVDPEDDFVADFYCIDDGSTANSAHLRLRKGALEMSPVSVRFHGVHGSRDVAAIITTVNYSGTVKGRLVFTSGEVAVQDTDIKHMQFAMVDFPRFAGNMSAYRMEISYSDFPNPGIMRALGRSEIDVDGWKIIIAECADKDVFGITHNGYIRKEDDSEFSIRGAKDLIDGLIYFFAFVTGVYRYPTIFIGTDAKGYAVWGRVIGFNQHKYIADNWFSKSRGAVSMQVLFPRFWNKFNSHNHEICSAVTSYAESAMVAHIGLTKNALPISQSALEALTRWALGRDMQWRESGREPAAEYIGEGLKKLGISGTLTEYPDVLALWQNEYNGNDDDGAGPAFITRLRNKIHPKIGSVDMSDYHKAWNLSQMYVELMLLKLCDYNGYYYNRATATRTSAAQLVPWAQSNP